MEKTFDIRLANDREALSDLLPEIDGRTFTVSKKEFLEALADLAFFFKNPEWMIYQWGSFRPIPIGEKGQFFLSIVDAIELGIALKRLSDCTNFNDVLKGFFNPSQFFDARFEVRAALFFLSLPTTKDVIFSPEYKVRGHIKRPDFDTIMKSKKITVECKSPNPFLSKALKKIGQIGTNFTKAMELVGWPDYLRLEINIINPFRGHLSSLASKIIKKALRINEDGKEEFLDENVQGFVLRKDSPFRITDVSLCHDIMNVGQTPTGLLNPEATYLRVASSRIEAQLSAQVGNCINKALKQLPEANDCIIIIEEVPFKVAQIACQRRFSDPTYSHVRAIGVLYEDGIKFIHRNIDKDFINELQLNLI